MKIKTNSPGPRPEGKLSWLLLWLLGVPLPILLLLYILRGCV